MKYVNEIDHYLREELPDLTLRPDNLKLYIESGSTQFYDGLENNDFIVKYKAVVVIEECQRDLAEVLFVLILWFKKHLTIIKPEESIKFHIEPLNTNKFDALFVLDLQETIQANDIEGRIRLDRTNDTRESLLEGPLDISIQRSAKAYE